MNQAILTIVNNVAEAIYRSTGKAIDVNSNKFVTDFNDIANSVRNGVPPTVTSDKLAEIIEKEVTNYIKDHIQEYEIVTHTSNIKSVSKIKRKLFLDSEITRLKSPLKNVISVKIFDISVTNNNLIINESNNKLVIVEDVGTDKRLFTVAQTIVLEPGDYTLNYLVEELQYLFNAAKFEHKYYIYHDPICKKICITTVNHGANKNTSINRIKSVTSESPLNFKFDESSTMLEILKISKVDVVSDAFISDSPINLKKVNTMEMTVYANQKPIFQEHITNSEQEFTKKFDTEYLFDDPLDISAFTVTLPGVNYSHDFTLNLEVVMADI